MKRSTKLLLAVACGAFMSLATSSSRAETIVVEDTVANGSSGGYYDYSTSAELTKTGAAQIGDSFTISRVDGFAGFLDGNAGSTAFDAFYTGANSSVWEAVALGAGTTPIKVTLVTGSVPNTPTPVVIDPVVTIQFADIYSNPTGNLSSWLSQDHVPGGGIDPTPGSGSVYMPGNPAGGPSTPLPAAWLGLSALMGVVGVRRLRGTTQVA